ncbi:MAG: class I fructose-bisphosphate aldolase [Rhodospirillales bacterium]
MNTAALNKIAAAMVAENRGLLAADESTGTITKRFDAIGVESSEENRRDYREFLFRSPDIGKYISGAILYDETIRQKAKDGAPLADVLQKNGVIPGIKVDGGAKDLPGAPGEKVTEGLDGLPGRMAEYHKLGARFAKWRAVITIAQADHHPSDYCIDANAHALARYARICQEAGVVPIVEPEVLMDGGHDIDLCEWVTERVQRAVFNALALHGAVLEGMILKPNMVISGTGCAKQADADEVARRTAASLRRCVPAAVPGIMFLSGGQSEADATNHLNIMNAKYGDNPWKLSFSYGRALQQSALNAWKGQKAQEAAGQAAFITRARLNSKACAGAYTGEAA